MFLFLCSDRDIIGITELRRASAGPRSCDGTLEGEKEYQSLQVLVLRNQEMMSG